MFRCKPAGMERASRVGCQGWTSGSDLSFRSSSWETSIHPCLEAEAAGQGYLVARQADSAFDLIVAVVAVVAVAVFDTGES